MRSVRGKLKQRAPVAKSGLRADFSTYRTLTELNLFLGRYDSTYDDNVYPCLQQSHCLLMFSNVVVVDCSRSQRFALVFSVRFVLLYVNHICALNK